MINSDKKTKKSKRNLSSLLLGIGLVLSLPTKADGNEFTVAAVDQLEEAPTLNYIQTQDFVEMDLRRGVYQVTLQVFKTTGTTISKIQTYLTDPWVTVPWDISNSATNQWIKLTAKVNIYSSVSYSKLRFQTSDHVSTGGGTGAVYVDDLTFTFLEEIPEEEDKPVLEIDPETVIQVFPNPVSATMTVLMPASGTISMTSLDGRVIAHFANISELKYSTAHLQTGVYLMHIQINGTTTVKKVIIE
ncbi:T9SS type A sorting domain-containing protein [Reichenbachiella carrageenanivorans]|uniref:T9SS type A sorting domain-containing protein n=1 Tax=Reichenbachiella carrageenanivorans TaxID=2979869 RepID=A0ABY6D100_9BACT|nr:T9SS type A sorting domain-containing protein [Reichenbachiella carrageenanivorans]UXX79369.1 T9SS type A sorting domain-containing protein [Reichenbachiella carrageenanivorans]